MNGKLSSKNLNEPIEFFEIVSILVITMTLYNVDMESNRTSIEGE